MADVIIKRKTKIIKKKQKGDTTLHYKDLITIRNWLITGSFSKTFFLTSNFDKTKIDMLRKVIRSNPYKIEEMFEETLKLTLNKKTHIYILVLLSNESFKSKKIFKENFNKIITSIDDLYCFMEYCKKERGLGTIIHEAIKKWFRHKSVKELQQIILEKRYGYNWTIKDIIRLIKPKPRDKTESLLFKWISKKQLTLDEVNDYREYLSQIYQFELMKRNPKNFDLQKEAILHLDFKNSMIPSEVKRTPELIKTIFINRNINQSVLEFQRYIQRMNVDEEIVSYFENNINNIKLSITELLSVVSGLQKLVNTGNEIKIFNIIETALISRIKKRYINALHIVDTNYDFMFGQNINTIGTNAAVISSVLIGESKNVINFEGNLVPKRTEREILEAEKYNDTTIKPKYNKIFSIIKNFENIKHVFIWSNRKNLNRKEFYTKFQLWKLENKKMMKVCFINLFNERERTRNNFYEISGVNKKTENIVEYIINDII